MSQRKVLLIVGLGAIAAIAVVAYRFDPETGTFPYPRCWIKLLTGLDCPGCGSTRALHALLHGRVVDAWRCNPAVFVAVPLIGLLLAAELPRFAWLRRRLFTPAAAATIVIMALIWTLLRNILCL